MADRIVEVKKQKKLSGDNIIEKTNMFVAIHNLTMDQLMPDIDLGGFPSPSIAIVRHMMLHNRYGDVSAIKKNTCSHAIFDTEGERGVCWGNRQLTGYRPIAIL